jgi:hypothetical protein
VGRLEPKKRSRSPLATAIALGGSGLACWVPLNEQRCSVRWRVMWRGGRGLGTRRWHGKGAFKEHLSPRKPSDPAMLGRCYSGAAAACVLRAVGGAGCPRFMTLTAADLGEGCPGGGRMNKQHGREQKAHGAKSKKTLGERRGERGEAAGVLAGGLVVFVREVVMWGRESPVALGENQPTQTGAWQQSRLPRPAISIFHVAAHARARHAGNQHY